MADIEVRAFIPSVFEENRSRLCQHFKKGDFCLFVGGKQLMRNADTELLFRQDSNFLYVCGVENPDCQFLLDVGTKESTLIIPDVDDAYPVWHGTPKSPERWKSEYGVTRVIYESKLNEYINSLKKDGHLSELYVLDREKSPFKDLVQENNPEIFKKALFASRAVKTPKEIEIMKETCRISSLGHIELMKKCKVGLKESHLESLFLHYTSWRGCRQQAYVPIVGTGTNSAVLHYNQNNALIKDGDLIVVDAGCEYLGYASDITRTFPANGKFSEAQKLVYSIVLNTQKKLVAEVKPGLDFKELAQHAKLYLTQGLIEAGFIQNCTPETAISSNILGLFMPHGLGHLLGLDVHDVSIYPETPLQPGMVITIEPGLYFNNFLIDGYLKDETKKQYLNADLLEKSRGFGGVRIEDDVLVLDEGSVCLTSLAPKEIEDIEILMKTTK